MSRLVWRLVLSMAICAAYFTESQAENVFTWHSSPYQFQKLLDLDLDTLIDIETVVSREELDMRSLEANAERTQLLVDLQLGDVDEVYKHPVSQYRLLDAWRTIESMPHLHIGENLALEETLEEASETFPNNDDRTAVLRNLYSIQKSHGLTAEDLARGFIAGERGHAMSANDCADMGRIAFSDKNDRFAVAWFQEALKKMARSESDVEDAENVRGELEDSSDSSACEDLCRRGQEVLRGGKNLQCSMWDNERDPWMLLQPVKMEVLETDPFVYRFYDVISDDEIAELKDLCWAKMVDAKTLGDWERPVELKSPRVAHHCYLDGDNNTVVARLNKRIEGITGLSMKNPVETLQVATYGIGGHYVPHYDANNMTSSFHTYRVATFMFYLSDVQKGGSTVFVRPGIAVRPQKGSAIFWYNLLPSGYLDTRTKHCACKILVGTKWIANQWIWQNEIGTCRQQTGLGQIRS